jgi:hypothetical protein
VPAVRTETATQTAPAGNPTLSAAPGPEVAGNAAANRPERRERHDSRRNGHFEEERRLQREARLIALADRLGLDENQFSIIAAAHEKADADRKALWDASRAAGKPPPDKSGFDAIVKAQEATISSVLGPDQQEAYTEFLAEEEQNRQEIFANRLLGEMQGRLHLSAEQKDRLFAVFAAQAASEGDPGPWAWAQTLKEGQVDNLREILTEDQFRLWERRVARWNQFFRPDKPPGDQPPGDKPPGDKPTGDKPPDARTGERPPAEPK